MEISVVMPVYNETNNELIQSINSILHQTYSNFEFIIVDDNPNSIRIKALLNKYSKIYSKIKILYNTISLGASSATNKGINIAQGKFIARMDADDIATSNRLKAQLQFISNNHLDLICSNFKGFSSDNYKSLTPYYGNISSINQDKIKHYLAYINIAMGPTLFFKRSSFVKIGGYRNLLDEDYDLILRFIINHFLVGYQSEVLLLKRNRKHNLSNLNSLNEFMIMLYISHYIQKDKYSHVIPIKEIIKYSSNISKRDKEAFNKFKYYFNQFKEQKSIKYLIYAIFITLSSKLVFKRNWWMLFVNSQKNRV